MLDNASIPATIKFASFGIFAMISMCMIFNERLNTQKKLKQAFSNLLSFLSKRLVIKHFSSHEISEKMCRNMWEVRLQSINLNPNVPPEKDYEAFRSFFLDSNTTAATLWNSNGELQGFYGWNLKTSNFQGMTYKRMYMEYGFMNKEYRGRPELNICILISGLKILWDGFGFPIFAVGVCYPSSYIKFRSAFQVFTFKSSNISEQHSSILQSFMNDYYEDTYDCSKKLVKMRTVPHPLHIRSHHVQSMIHEYLELNPIWKDGYGMPIIFDMNITTFYRYFKGKIASILGLRRK